METVGNGEKVDRFKRCFRSYIQQDMWSEGKDKGLVFPFSRAEVRGWRQCLEKKTSLDIDQQMVAIKRCM